MKRKNNEIKAVFRFSDPYEKLDYIENNINDIIPVIEKTDIEYRDIIIQKLQRIQDILDRHHGLLLYARKNHGFDLDKILDQWYYDREYKKEEIKKAYK
jgi:Leucine-rich repeat (LRR) protein